MSSLAEVLPQEIARVRKLIAEYRALPNGAGMIGATLMEAQLRAADIAMVSGDVVAMLNIYQDLKSCE